MAKPKLLLLNSNKIDFNTLKDGLAEEYDVQAFDTLDKFYEFDSRFSCQKIKFAVLDVMLIYKMERKEEAGLDLTIQIRTNQLQSVAQDARIVFVSCRHNSIIKRKVAQLDVKYLPQHCYIGDVLQALKEE